MFSNGKRNNVEQNKNQTAKKMKTFRIIYNSPKNAFKGEVFTKKNSSPEAMAEFFDWLKEQAVWTHLWCIQVNIEEVEEAKWI
jgi:hypothetical protein